MVLCLKWNFKILSETIRFYFQNKEEEKDPHNLSNIPLTPEHKRRNDLSNLKPFCCFRGKNSYSCSKFHECYHNETDHGFRLVLHNLNIYIILLQAELLK